MEWGYTCRQRPIKGKGDYYVGLQPIGAVENRDWCPGRPWLAHDSDDVSQRKPMDGDDGVWNDTLKNFNNVIVG